MTAVTNRVAASVPALAAAISSYQAFLDSVVEPGLVELCRLRVAQIVDGTDEPPPRADGVGSIVSDDQLRELADWSTSDQFDATEKACLQLAEYFCYNAQSVTDEHVAHVSARLAAEQVLALTTSLWLADASARLANFLDSLDIDRETPR